MRWVVTLLTAVCLLGARTGRAEELRVRTDAPAQLHAGAGDLVATLAPRRTGHHGELRLPAFLAPARSTFTPPPRGRILTVSLARTHVAERIVPTPSSRGPPQVESIAVSNRFTTCKELSCPPKKSARRLVRPKPGVSATP